MTKTKILADSVNPDGQRITTFLVTYPRYIHAEIMTHRALSRNAASSRAVPIQKMIDDVRTNPVIPAQWGKKQKGMQSSEVLEPDAVEKALIAWRGGLGEALVCCEILDGLQVHKQWANRVIEPWMHITVLITATEWGNFFNLRAHPAAHPDFQELAYRMLHRYVRSVPTQMNWGGWHVPFGEDMPGSGVCHCGTETNKHTQSDNHGPVEMPLPIQDQIRIATARAARLSYMTFEGVIDIDKDIGLHDSLIANVHMSPTEHCAMAEPVIPEVYNTLAEILQSFPEPQRLHSVGNILEGLKKYVKRDQGNFRGWTPYRKQFPNENQASFDPEALLAKKPGWIQLEE
jgi:thymidylate synthase ThyX